MNVTASDWLINLEENPDDLQLRQRFELWLSLNDENRQDWEAATETWRLLGMTVPAYPELLARTKDASLGEADKGRGIEHIQTVSVGVSDTQSLNVAANDNKRSWGKIAMASCAALILTFITSYFGGLDRFRADHLTLAGEIREITLEDGSIVTLSPETALAVSMSNERRNIQLLSGAAYFSVTPDKERPFVVNSRDITTTVLGTAFNVDIVNEDTKVSVTHGRVAVAKQEHPSFELIKGDVLTVNQQGKVSRNKTAVENIAAWRMGQLYVKNKPVKDVISNLDHFYKGWILVQSDKLDKKKLTGVYNLSDPVSALSVIAETYELETYQISPWFVVVTD